MTYAQTVLLHNPDLDPHVASDNIAMAAAYIHDLTVRDGGNVRVGGGRLLPGAEIGAGRGDCSPRPRLRHRHLQLRRRSSPRPADATAARPRRALSWPMAGPEGSRLRSPPRASAALCGPSGESRLLPRAAYVEQAVFDWEQRHFFRGGWMCVARSEDVAQVGDQRAESVGGAGVFLVRGRGPSGYGASPTPVGTGATSCCRAASPATCHVVVCPYHSWSYRLDGSLRNAPRFDEWDARSSPRRTAWSSCPPRSGTGLVFVDASGRARPRAPTEHFAGLERPRRRPTSPSGCGSAAHHDYVVEANWKIVIENYQECYHCAMIHPELCAVSPPRSGENYPA